MIRLIVSDIDGTLLPYGAREISPRAFDLIDGLRAKGILFCPASGRQYHSLRGLFAPVADEVAYLCENGGMLYGPGKEESAPVLGKTPMGQADAVALAQEILSRPDCEVVVSGANRSYVSARNREFIRWLEKGTGNLITPVEHMSQVPEEIVKVAAFHNGDLSALQRELGPRWGERFSMAVAGAQWLDFTLADKGKGLAGLCAALGVAMEQTAAFGDNWNDLAMLERAGRPYLMETADPGLQGRGFLPCRRVEDTLEELLKEA